VSPKNPTTSRDLRGSTRGRGKVKHVAERRVAARSRPDRDGSRPCPRFADFVPSFANSGRNTRKIAKNTSKSPKTRKHQKMDEVISDFWSLNKPVGNTDRFPSDFRTGMPEPLAKNRTHRLVLVQFLDPIAISNFGNLRISTCRDKLY